MRPDDEELAGIAAELSNDPDFTARFVEAALEQTDGRWRALIAGVGWGAVTVMLVGLDLLWQLPWLLIPATVVLALALGSLLRLLPGTARGVRRTR